MGCSADNLLVIAGGPAGPALPSGIFRASDPGIYTARRDRQKICAAMLLSAAFTVVLYFNRFGTLL
jgi:hypothetical protein